MDFPEFQKEIIFLNTIQHDVTKSTSFFPKILLNHTRETTKKFIYKTCKDKNQLNFITTFFMTIYVKDQILIKENKDTQKSKKKRNI